MASENGNPTDNLEERLVENARRFDFFQLVQLLERATGGAPIGYQGPARQECVRFRAAPSLGFPPGDVAGLKRLAPRSDLASRYELTVNFMGLYGPASPMPAHYTEAVIAADLDETNRRDFLDFFHQRVLAFLFRSWKRYRYYANFLRGAEDEFSQRIFCLLGAQSRTFREGAELDWTRLLACSGLVAMVGASADALERTVNHYFDGLGARVVPYIERRVTLEPNQRAYLARANTTLGTDVIVGRTILDRAGKFRLVLGPMGWDLLNDFLPGQPRFRTVVTLVKMMLKDALAFDLLLLVKRPDVQRLEIDRRNSCRLGWTTWLGHPDRESMAVRLQI